jgi:hypothetical protein
VCRGGAHKKVEAINVAAIRLDTVAQLIALARALLEKTSDGMSHAPGPIPSEKAHRYSASAPTGTNATANVSACERHQERYKNTQHNGVHAQEEVSPSGVLSPPDAWEPVCAECAGRCGAHGSPPASLASIGMELMCIARMINARAIPAHDPRSRGRLPRVSKSGPATKIHASFSSPNRIR